MGTKLFAKAFGKYVQICLVIFSFETIQRPLQLLYKFFIFYRIDKGSLYKY